MIAAKPVMPCFIAAVFQVNRPRFVDWAARKFLISAVLISVQLPLWSSFPVNASLLYPAAIAMTSSLDHSFSADPLNSPYPVPWQWVMTMMADKNASAASAFRYYRTESLVSPDGTYAVYSRIQLQLSANFTQNRIASILFVENLQTGELQTIMPAAPFADNPFVADAVLNQPGTIAMLIPVAWSERGDRLLAREFESMFGSSLASDFAVIWDRPSNRTYTLAPTQVQYSNAVLLGWSRTHPSQVLFRAGNMGEEDWPIYAVDTSGQTTRAVEDQPIAFGQANSIWAGPQGYSCA